MRHYEVVVIIHPDQSDQVGVMLNHYSKIVTSRDGKIHRVEDWGRRVLAYSINKIHKAHYALMNIECSEEALQELQRTFRFSDAVLRYVALRMDKAETGPSAIMLEKEKMAQGGRKSSEELTDRDLDDLEKLVPEAEPIVP